MEGDATPGAPLAPAMQGLPDDVLSRVLEHLLAPEDLARAMAVCRGWRDIVLAHQLWWRLCIRLCPESALLVGVESPAGHRAWAAGSGGAAAGSVALQGYEGGPSANPGATGSSSAATLHGGSTAVAQGMSISCRDSGAAVQALPSCRQVEAAYTAASAPDAPGAVQAGGQHRPGWLPAGSSARPVDPMESAGIEETLADGRHEGELGVRGGGTMEEGPKGPSNEEAHVSDDEVVWRIMSKLCWHISAARTLSGPPPVLGPPAVRQPALALLAEQAVPARAGLVAPLGARQGGRVLADPTMAGADAPLPRAGERRGSPGVESSPPGSSSASSLSSRTSTPSPSSGRSPGSGASPAARASLRGATNRIPPAAARCIGAALEASSTDNYPLEGIEKTLEPLPRWPDPFTPSYWSSKGQANPRVPEALVYALSAPVCLITEFAVRPFRAFFQDHEPIYSPRFVRLRLGRMVSSSPRLQRRRAPLDPNGLPHGARPLDWGDQDAEEMEAEEDEEDAVMRLWGHEEWESVEYSLPQGVGEGRGRAGPHTSRGAGEPQSSLDVACYEWTYVSPAYPMLQEDTQQRFVLPRPVLCLGQIAQVDLLERVQTQSSDDLYYICVCHVQIAGKPLPMFDLRVLSPPPPQEATFSVACADHSQKHCCCPTGCVSCQGTLAALPSSSAAAFGPHGLPRRTVPAETPSSAPAPIPPGAVYSGACCCINAASVSEQGLTKARPALLLQERAQQLQPAVPLPPTARRAATVGPLFQHFWRQVGLNPNQGDQDPGEPAPAGFVRHRERGPGQRAAERTDVGSDDFVHSAGAPREDVGAHDPGARARGQGEPERGSPWARRMFQTRLRQLFGGARRPRAEPDGASLREPRRHRGGEAAVGIPGVGAPGDLGAINVLDAMEEWAEPASGTAAAADDGNHLRMASMHGGFPTGPGLATGTPGLGQLFDPLEMQLDEYLPQRLQPVRRVLWHSGGQGGPLPDGAGYADAPLGPALEASRLESAHEIDASAGPSRSLDLRTAGSVQGQGNRQIEEEFQNPAAMMSMAHHPEEGAGIQQGRNADMPEEATAGEDVLSEALIYD